MVLPIILMLFFGVLEIGRTLLLQHSADTAAYEGARSAMVPGATVEDARKAATELLVAARVTNFEIQVDPDKIEEGTALISVDVTIPVDQNSWVIPSFVSNVTVESNVTLFTERPPVVKLSGVEELKKKLKGVKNKKASL